MNIEKLIKNISSRWFYEEPLLFSVLCTHSVVQNDGMNVPMRTGQKRIEFCQPLLEKYDESQVEEYLKIEVLRILLQHPYARQPHNAKKRILLLASDVTLYQFYRTKVPLAGVEYLKAQAGKFKILNNVLPAKWRDTEEEKFFLRNLQLDPKTGCLVTLDDLTFEKWYRKILFLIQETASGEGENAGSADDSSAFSRSSEEAADLWDEDQEIQAEINEQTQKAEREQGWGGLGGTLQRGIMEASDFKMDYRRILAQFRAASVSSERTLTRMRPNRRFGFSAMGSRYERKANILVAVDVSGSITDESFARFFHVINNFFVYGIEKLDVIFFDTNLKFTKPVSARRHLNLKEIKGRGGTNFQPAIDFFQEHQEYNGMIIFTDGEGNIPKFSRHRLNLMWILSTRLDYEKSRQWIENLPGSRAAYLPF